MIKVVKYMERIRDINLFDGVRITCTAGAGVEILSYGVATFERFTEEHKNAPLVNIVRDLEQMGFTEVRTIVAEV